MASLSEKFKQMGMENLERQRMMAAYDIPPKLIREVFRQNSAPNNNTRKPNTNRYSVSCSELKSGNSDLSRLLSDNLSQSFNNHIYTNTPSSPNRNFSSDASPGNFNHNYQKNKPLTINPLCIIEDEARTAFDRSKRMEAMQKLQKQENDLHKEISLLDEILLVCKKDDPAAQMAREKFSFSEKASSLPNKSKKETDTSSKSVHSSTESSHKASSSHTDLTKVKKRTKISAPLPYVNLSEFDVGEDNGHVHLSKEGLVTGASTRSLNKSPVPSTGSPAKRSNESLNSSRSSDYHNQLTPAWIREPIYANEPPPRPETPPPELPPKGPALLRKNRLSRNSTSFSASTPPPIPPSRNRSRSLGSQGKNGINSTKNQSYDQVVPVPVPVPSKPVVEDTYLMMGDFPCEPRERKKSITYNDSQDQRRLSKGNADVMSCYMDMAAMFQKESSSYVNKEIRNRSPIYDTIDCPTEQAPAPPIRESNYMVMEAKNIRKRSVSEEKPVNTPSASVETGSPIITKRNSVIQKLQTLQTYVSTTKAGEAKGSQVTPKPVMPFQNLIDFQPQYKKPAGVYVSHISNQPTAQDEATASPEPTTKEGFLARFKRRNSKDQKATQSTENLMFNIKTSRSNILEKSHSEDCESIKSSTSSSPVKIIRQRSSSFPNRRSFQEEEIETDKLVNESLRADSLNDEVFTQSEKSKEPLETFQSKSSIKLNSSNKTEIQEDVNKEMRVLTVLHVQQDPPTKNLYSHFDSSQTDDEKMIALLDDTSLKKPTYTFMSELKSKLTLSLSKIGYEGVYPEEVAPPLPPFLPPKNYKLYPTLSPVVETTPSSTPHSNEQESIYVMMKEPKNKRTSTAPPQQGTKAVDVDSDSDPSDISRDSLTDDISLTVYQRALLQCNHLLVSVEDIRSRLEQDDDIVSLSSNEYLDTNNYSDSMIESSPAKTVLRPRFGYEYAIIERRTASSESSNSPTSPSTNSVFTFDIHEPGASNVEGTGTIRSPITNKSKSSKSDDSVPTSPWIPLPNKCLKKQLSTARLRDRTRNDSVSNSDSAPAKERHSSVSSTQRSDSISRRSSVSRRRSESSSRTSRRRTSSVRSKYGTDTSKPLLKRSESYHQESDSDSESVNISLHGISESVSYRKDITSSSALRLMEGTGKKSDVYLHLWDTKAGKSTSPKASVSSESPPISPKHAFLQPLTPISDDQEELNYLVMDLGPPSNSLTKPKKSVPKSSEDTIEYSSIDMVATVALKEAGKEHAQDRCDSLRRTRSVLYKTPLSHHTSLKERKGSFTFGRDRKHSASSAVES
ncbi:hypothetical protein LOTGIDRAFT_170399 [Lottia gigantea]|uniref:Uncharacterized protein n=1 Tax=Lottia gigantea TaxID=225164 RepID=V4B1A8_LOTGI|nr:hypothetical protein LOTGIDRAFT_170399 [Lottia gigantea]ESO81989.1 hypothetical protein LOTGIDRAFT_170399 [Lottia gigantea]